MYTLLSRGCHSYLTDPRVTLVSKSQQRGLGGLQNATYVRGVPVFGTPCPASPSVIFSQKTEQLLRSVLHQFIDVFVRDFGETRNNDSNPGPNPPKAGGGPEDIRPGPGETAGAVVTGPRHWLLILAHATTTPGMHQGTSAALRRPLVAHAGTRSSRNS